MAGTKMFAHRMMLTVAVIGFGVAASGVAYKAAGAVLTIGAYAIGR